MVALREVGDNDPLAPLNEAGESEDGWLTTAEMVLPGTTNHKPQRTRNTSSINAADSAFERERSRRRGTCRSTCADSTVEPPAVIKPAMSGDVAFALDAVEQTLMLPAGQAPKPGILRS